MLYLDKTGEVIRAHPRFMMVLSYNPGYQSIVKDLKQSTKQRFASLIFLHPQVDTETRIIVSETGLSRIDSGRLAEMGSKLRELKGFGLDEGVSTRLLVYVGRLMRAGLSVQDACTSAIRSSPGAVDRAKCKARGQVLRPQVDRKTPALDPDQLACPGSQRLAGATVANATATPRRRSPSSEPESSRKRSRLSQAAGAEAQPATLRALPRQERPR